MTYKAAGLWVLAGLVSLPFSVKATESQWQFAGSSYHVSGEAPAYTATVKRNIALNASQMKALCRKGLGLPLRAEYEQQLLDNGLIKQTMSDWPVTRLSYQLEDIRFDRVKKQSATCSATVIDSGKQTNLPYTALSYATAYYSTKQYAELKTMLPYLMQQPAISMDAAGLVTLLLSQRDTVKAQAYFYQHVDIEKMQVDDIKLLLAQWFQQQGELIESHTIATQCQADACQYLMLEVEDAIAEQEEASAGDLSSYFLR